MTDFAAPEIRAHQGCRTPPTPYGGTGVGGANLLPHLPHLAAPNLCRCGNATPAVGVTDALGVPALAEATPVAAAWAGIQREASR
jgi:hypothetical protein